MAEEAAESADLNIEHVPGDTPMGQPGGDVRSALDAVTTRVNTEAAQEEEARLQKEEAEFAREEAGEPPDGEEDAEAQGEQEEDAEAKPEGEEGEGEQEPELDLSGEELPEKLLDKKVKVTVNGEEQLVSIKDAASGYMRHADYTRGKQALSQERRQFQGEVSQVKTAFEGWRKDPETLRTALKKLGMPFDEAARIELAERLEESSLSDEQRELRRLKREVEELRERRQQPQKQPQQNAGTQEIVKNLQTWIPTAFESAGLPDNKTMRGLLRDHLSGIWQEGRPVTQQDVETAAKAVAEELGDLKPKPAKKAEAKQEPKKQAPPVPRSGGGAKPASRGTQARPKVTPKNISSLLDQKFGPAYKAR